MAEVSKLEIVDKQRGIERNVNSCWRFNAGWLTSRERHVGFRLAPPGQVAAQKWSPLLIVYSIGRGDECSLEGQQFKLVAWLQGVCDGSMLNRRLLV